VSTQFYSVQIDAESVLQTALEMAGSVECITASSGSQSLATRSALRASAATLPASDTSGLRECQCPGDRSGELARPGTVSVP
jgi:hypothetical protein